MHSPIFIPEVSVVQTAAAIATEGTKGNFRGEVLFDRTCSLPIPPAQLYVVIVDESALGAKSEMARFSLQDYRFDKNFLFKSAGTYRAALRFERTDEMLASKSFKAQPTINLIFRVDCK
ncbi:MAG: hypothetical protein EOP04_02800 [Proteobacteria bacterium]|nr:MAG: hypothetical protein EOP04_02800 [Pseudomonadota bacterium]